MEELQLLYLYIYLSHNIIYLLIAWSLLYFSYTTATSIVVEGNQTVPEGNPRPFAGCDFPTCARRGGHAA